MIMEVTHFIQACPVCGRPLQVHTDYSGQLVICQHCRGQFVASHSDDSGLGERGECGSSAQRADRLLAMFACRLGVHRCWPLVRRHDNAERRTSSVCTADTREGSYTDVKEDTSYQAENTEVRDMPTVLMMEHRDDVLCRLTADLAARGVRPTRATNAAQAIRQYVHRPTDVLIVNADHPHESAWLLAAKLHLTHPTARIWVYKRRLSDHDTATAGFLRIDELIEHENDLRCLAMEILDRLVRLPGHASRLSDRGDRTATDQAGA